MEAVGSWDAIEWTKIEPLSQSHGMGEFLLEAEEVVAQGHGVVLVNTDEAGTLSVTNFRLLFVSEISRDVIELGTMPLATIEKFSKQVTKLTPALRNAEKAQSRRLLQVIGKDMRIVVFAFRPRTRQRRAVFEAIGKYAKPARLWDLYTFICGPSTFRNTSPKLRLLNEYLRLLGKDSLHVSGDMVEDGSFTVDNESWRITSINSTYALCATYPSSLIVPKSIRDEEILQASTFRAKCRLPVVSWCHPGTGAVIARSSQPHVGIMMNMRSNADERLVAALCSQITGGQGSRRKLYIADARPRKNAFANGAMGGGSESSSNYFQTEVVFFGIENIHTMRDSLIRLREYVDTHGATSSDGMSSFLRHGGWTWGGGNLSSMSASVSTLGDSGWLIHVQTVLAGSAWIAARVDLEAASVLVHCSDGWDRTTQLVSLASLLLDPYYRTFKGFEALVEKDWLAFGHPFAERMGTPTIFGNSNNSELSRQSSGANVSRQSSGSSISASLMRSSSGTGSATSGGGSSQGHASNNCSPIFLQWVDCIAQLLRMYPCAFEYSSAFLVDFLDCFLSCRFGNFLCNSEKERQQAGVSDVCGCIWMYMASLRAPEDGSHVHYNVFYDSTRHDGPLLPPAAALAPTIWPQFHLRWACPSEARSGELDSHLRIMTKQYAEMTKAKEMAEQKVKELRLSMDSLTMDLQKEKKLRESAVYMAKRSRRETLAIDRAAQSLGIKVQFSGKGSREETRRSSDFEGKQDDSADFCVSISAIEDSLVGDNPISRRVCENICPFSTRGGCKWPDAACAQLSSQFVGFKADFEAIEQLSIYEGYFEPE